MTTATKTTTLAPAVAPARPGRETIALALLLAALLAVPVLLDNAFIYHVFVTICVFAALSTAWNIVGGFTGQLSLGHGIFYGIGAYAGVILASLGSPRGSGCSSAPGSRWSSRWRSAIRASACAGRSSRSPPSHSSRSSASWRCTSAISPAAPPG